MLRNILLVGVGGMVGSIARYLVAVWFSQRLPIGFPFGTFTVNIAGCFLIGLILGAAGRLGFLSLEWRLLLATGFCGGFTTYSSLMYEAVEMIEAGQYAMLALYVVSTTLLALLATVTGLALTR
ncbi:MAG: fluoride efflux transporter CrcB [Bacteroidota bacterium]|nr:fluoride efflux transporter CrcB [Candidatus Kapabacteria bacterium]MCS7303068.1 fluoride efflux transporter CrcB [Candidatus Kapabacteria bacterium]MCX7937631.1 fluoride efflux transporter CrcB [Chlorobiota bacterium]MDW8075211.1 fluoride efflux transporter CrcB [Bacteroidota bacterium]MDW8272443.1 fluoride efflux transporter CrcB [Bacteroidota bacterium]